MANRVYNDPIMGTRSEMIQGNRLQRLMYLLEQQGLADEYGDSLPDPHYVQDLIRMTNNGCFEEALAALEKTERLLASLSAHLSQEDISWFSDIMRELHRSIHTARIT